MAKTNPVVPNMDAENAPKKKKNCIKIIIGIIVAIVLIIIIALVATSGMTKVIDSQLSALRSGDINTAYSLTSKQFQSTTSLEQFKAFLNQNPSLLNNKSSTFTNRTNENGLGTVEGTLTAKDGSVTPVAYQLVKENGEWKIQGLKVNPGGVQTQTQNTSAQQPQTDIVADIKVSDSAGADNVVKTGKTTFTTTTSGLAISVYVSNGKKGDQVAIKLVHADSGEESSPVTNDISQDGDLISNFSFAKPASNWPAGTYKIMAATTSGSKGEFTFQVK